MMISTTFRRALYSVIAVFAITTPVAAEPTGSAIYASYKDSSYAAFEAQKLRVLLQSPIETNQVVINERTYTRLQSPAQSADAARALVEQAKLAGYSAWFINAKPVASQPGTPQPGTPQPVVSKPVVKNTVTSAAKNLILGPDNPELKLQLPEGPLLGDLFPPSSPLPE